MKDSDMSEQLSQEDFLKAKAVLDRCLKQVGRLIEDAEGAMVDCCRANALDTRDQFAELAAELSLMRGHGLRARSIGGQIEGNGLTKSGST